MNAEEKKRLIEVSLDAWRGILAQVDGDTRERMTRTLVESILARADGDIELADAMLKAECLDLATLRRISQAQAWRWLRTVAVIVATAVASHTGALGGAAVGLVAYFLGDGDDD